MISVYDIKPKFQKLLFPLLTVLRRLGITPNHITVFSILFSFLIGFLFLQATENKIFYLVVALGLLLRMGLNALDGMMANKYNLKSTKGEILNEIGDVISDIAIYFPLLYFENLKFEYVVLFIVLSFVSCKNTNNTTTNEIIAFMIDEKARRYGISRSALLKIFAINGELMVDKLDRDNLRMPIT